MPPHHESGPAAPSQKLTPPSPKPKPWIAYAVLCAITVIAYANSFGLGFALDGRSKVLTDSRVQAVSSENIHLILAKDYWWPRPTDRLYRPVTLASYLFNYAVLGNGGSPTGYHIVNLLLHILNVCLLFELALLIFRNREWALLAAALWAVHPLQTEAVANVAGRADLLGAAAVLGGLLIYIRLLDLVGTPKKIWLAALFLVALLGVFSKENAAVLVGLMVLWDLAFGWQKKPGWKPRQSAYFLMAAVVGILMVARWKVFQGEPWPEMPFLDNPIQGAGLLEGRLTAISVIGRYLGLLLWPAQLSFDYAYNQIPIARLSDIGPWLVLLLVCGILATVVARYHADRALFWAAGFFAVALLPTANLIFPIGAIMALRFLYLPSAGFAIAAVVLLTRINRPTISRAVIAVIIIALAARTLVRIPAWQDNLALGAADVVSAPASFRSHQILAQALYEQDPKANLDFTIREYETTYRVIRELPPEQSCAQCLSELGMFYYAKANATGGASSPEGHTWLEKALQMLENARTVSVAQGREFRNEQIAHGRQSFFTHGDPNLYLYLARTYTHLGRPEQALQTYRELQGQDPMRRELYDEMATVYAAKGQLEQAAVVMDEKAFLLGINNSTAASLRNLYARIPDGACALKPLGDSAELNLDCPRLRSDMCQGWAELDPTLRAAHRTQQADSMRASAIQRYGCPAEFFNTGR